MIQKLDDLLCELHYHVWCFRYQYPIVFDAVFVFLVVMWFGLLILFWVRHVI